MQLTTLVSLPEIPVSVTYETPVFLIGSCFSDVLGNRLNERKFSVLSNPFGTVYNPASINRMIQSILDNHVPEADDIQHHNGIYFHPDYHSDVSAMSRHETLTRIQLATENAHEFLQKASCIFITFGTAIVYREKKSDQVVANCHKLPADRFVKKLLSIDDICRDSEKMIRNLREKCPDIPIVFTVSPVRHIRDGLIENNRSKARLLEAVHLLSENLPGVYYFPSYELVMDQLRDYRFYEKDMIHPNELAHDVVWEMFSDTFFDVKTKQIIFRIEKIMMAFRHRPRFDQHPDYGLFCRKQIIDIDALKSCIPTEKLGEERVYFLSKSGLSQD